MNVIQQCAASIMGIPNHILWEIILTLPLKEVATCRCVCKTWQHLVSDPEFSKQYFVNSQILIRPISDRRVSRMLYLVDPSKIIYKDNSFDCICCDSEYIPTCPYHIIMKLDTKLKIPVDNIEILKHTGDMSPHSSVKRKQCIKYENASDHKFEIVNSCDGLLCLSKFYNHPEVVCNPMTGEFIRLPEGNHADGSSVNCGLGFSVRDKQYKVLRIFDQGHPSKVCCHVEGREKYTMRFAEIHTLGMNSWKGLGSVNAPFMSCYPTCLNGALHWYYPLCDHSNFIFSFDFNTEQFQKIHLPECFHNKHYLGHSIHLTVFRGCLSLYGDRNPDSLQIWYMKEYGVQDSWTEEVIHCEYMATWPRISYHPFCYSKNGELLIVDYVRNALILYDHDPEKPTPNYAWIQGIKCDFKVIAYTPNFSSLKNVVMGNTEIVKSIFSRCAEFKFWGEGPLLSLVQETLE